MTTATLTRTCEPLPKGERISVRAQPVDVRRSGPRRRQAVRTHVSAAHLSKLADISMTSIMQNDPAKATFVEID